MANAIKGGIKKGSLTKIEKQIGSVMDSAKKTKETQTVLKLSGSMKAIPMNPATGECKVEPAYNEVVRKVAEANFVETIMQTDWRDSTSVTVSAVEVAQAERQVLSEVDHAFTSTLEAVKHIAVMLRIYPQPTAVAQTRPMIIPEGVMFDQITLLCMARMKQLATLADDGFSSIQQHANLWNMLKGEFEPGDAKVEFPDNGKRMPQWKSIAMMAQCELANFKKQVAEFTLEEFKAYKASAQSLPVFESEKWAAGVLAGTKPNTSINAKVTVANSVKVEVPGLVVLKKEWNG